MKTLTKIKLINWHGFYDNTISIKDATLFTGDNGCGKSSLIDAIYFLLTGGDDSKFNTAANERAKRSLETYMRGRTGTEGNEYLRNQSNIITHIALEFTDSITQKTFIIGIVLEIQESKNKVGKSFYHIIGKGINEKLFSTVKDGEKHYLNYRAMEKKIGKSNINPLDSASESRVSIRKNIYNILDLNSKYYDLLPKAIAFKPIPDVNEFVYKFLMPEKAVDLKNIRDVIQTYNEIQEKIKQDKAKKTQLEKITEAGGKYTAAIKEKQLLEAYKIVSEYATSQQSFKTLTEKIERADKELAQEEKNRQSYERQIAIISRDITLLEHNEAYLALKEIENELNIERANVEKLKSSVANLNKYLMDETSIAELLEIDVNLQKYIKSKDFSAMLSALNEYKSKYDEKVDQINNDIYSYEQKLKDLLSEQKELTEEKEQLQKGLPSYHREVTALIDVIKNIIFDENGKPISVTPFCELLEIREGMEEWRNAAEGYLNTRRFDLFVAEQYYDEALRIYERYKIEMKIYGVGLVNTAKIKEVECQQNSLAEKLIAEDENARKYLDFLMGNVICVSSEDELKNYERSITKTVMVYQNKAARQTKKEAYSTPYIGKKSSKIRFVQVCEKLKDIENNISGISENKRKLEVLRRGASNTKYTLIANSENVWSQYDKCIEAIKILQNRLNEAKKNNDLEPKIEAHRQQLAFLLEKKKGCEDKIINLKADIQTAKEKKSTVEQTIKQLVPIISELQSDAIIWNETEEFYNSHHYSLDECTAKINSTQRDIDRLKDTLPILMKTYITDFGFDANADIDSLDVFIREYNEVVVRDLEKFEIKLEEAKQLATESFKESYIAKIRSNIQDEKRNINKLNKILQNKPFGSDEEIYQFVIKRSDVKEFGDYYDIFDGTEDYNINDLFTEQLSDKNYNLMQDLFVLLTATDQSDKQDQLIRNYTDYRRFMSYDIKITNKRNEVSYFSKINNEKSGGEIQTPFYVIIAASFDQIIHSEHRLKSPGCIVMFDEAFNNMDGARISSLLEYFKELEIQPLIAVPTERSRTIMPYVPTTVALLKNHNIILAKSHTK